jgi:hypothetical protein
MFCSAAMVSGDVVAANPNSGAASKKTRRTIFFM